MCSIVLFHLLRGLDEALAPEQLIYLPLLPRDTEPDDFRQRLRGPKHAHTLLVEFI